jgi:hypothetical protein
MQAVVVAAFAAGILLWIGAYGGSWLAWALAACALLAALALDVALWERVDLSHEHLWFQRGLAGRVHQVLIENIRDVKVQQADVRGLTLRRGRDNAYVRLKVRMRDRHVAALPKTGAYSGRGDVELVAAMIEERLASLRAEAAMRPVDPDLKLKRALKKLRRNADAAQAA